MKDNCMKQKKGYKPFRIFQTIKKGDNKVKTAADPIENFNEMIETYRLSLLNSMGYRREDSL